MSVWTKFWNWYDRHLTESLFLTAFVIYIQIPHMVWNADLWLETGLNIARVNPVLDFLLFGIDFLLLATFVSSSFFVSLGTK